ncbi:zinc finger CW-type PWWP domain protein 1 isoform X1 [Astyanax mexicanus]|uniref:zinc finger CW-type PWWP domain protein 1 isoform X1 n=1 Tax=Astyanax mexicanus TaxID=7994 RepID=UPI0020CB0757|nr:zinc finger CW-type PWWP domain protein 1 isoform X1 [Astyanax mexicanus]
MDEKHGNKEKSAIVSPISQANNTESNKTKVEVKTAMTNGQSEEKKKGKGSKPGETDERTGYEQLKPSQAEKEPRKRVHEQEMNGAVVGTKRGKVEMNGREDEETTKEKTENENDQVVQRSGEEIDDETQQTTASNFELLEAMLDYSLSGLIEDTKAMLTEVESMQSCIQQKAHRDEQERGSCSTTLDKESMKEMKGRSVCEKEEVNSESDEYVVWVQCSKANCGKWRKLDEDVDPSMLPDDWICENNPDPAFCSCSAPEEQSSMCEEKIFFSNLVPGSLVWVQQNGHFWWPAMVQRDPETDDYLEFHRKTDLDPCTCHVTYFGDPVCIGWVLCSNVRNYADLSENDVLSMLEFQELKEKLKDAICMSKQALDLSPQMRLVKFGFWTRYDSEEDSDVREVLELFSGKTGKYSDDEDAWPKKQKRCLKKREDKQKKRAKSGSKKECAERSGEKKQQKKSENGKSVNKKKMEGGGKVGKHARNAEEAALKVTEQKDLTDLMFKEGLKKKSFAPSFSQPKKNKTSEKTDAVKQQIQDQMVPESTMETSPDSSCSNKQKKKNCGSEDVKRKERNRDEEGNDEKMIKKQDKQKNLQRWEDEFGSEEEAFIDGMEGAGDEEGFLDSDMDILGCGGKEVDHLSCTEHEELEEEPSSFSLMLLEEE